MLYYIQGLVLYIIANSKIRGLVSFALLGYLLLAQLSCIPATLDFQTAHAELASPLFVTYQNSTYGIAIQYPTLWQKNEDLDPSTGGIVQLIAPKENANDTYQENLVINYVDLPRNTKLQNYTDFLMQSYKENVNNFTLIQSNSSSLAAQPAHLVVFTATSDEGLDYKALNVWTIIGNRSLIVTYYAAPASHLWE